MHTMIAIWMRRLIHDSAVGILTSVMVVHWSFGTDINLPPAQQRDITQPLSPNEALTSIQVRQGFQLELAASEPLVKDPVAIDWDIEGRLWVVEMADYPLGIDGKGKSGGRVRVLEDTNQDGRYDKSTLFLDGLSFPNGILTWRDGVLITAAPDILYAVDIDGDGRADKQEKLFTGFNPGNQQLRMNGLRWGLDNWIYCASGSHHAGYGAKTGVTTVATGQRTVIGSRDFRIRPDEHRIDPQSGPSQFGRNRDDWGNWFGVQNSYPLWHYVLADHYLRRNPYYAPPNPRRNLTEPNPILYPIKKQKRFHSFEHATRFTSACSGMIYRDTLLFGESSMAGSLQHSFTCDPFHSLVQHNLVRKAGTSFQVSRDPDEEQSEFFASTDRWCRPVMVRSGPDGALWVVDMYRYMIEHPEWVNEAARNELRPYYRHGEEHGRIYRILPTHQAADKNRFVPHLADLNTAQLVNKLADTNGWVRDKCQQLLLWKADRSSANPLKKLATDRSSPRARLHALCTLEGLDALDDATLLAALSDEHAGVRRHATRLAAERRSAAITAALPPLAQDDDAQVRLQLAFSLGELDVPSLDVVLAELLIDPRNDMYIQAAAMSSITSRSIPTVLSEVLPADTLSPGVLRGLLRIAVKSAPETLATTVAMIGNSDRTQRWRFETLAALLDVMPLEDLKSFAETNQVPTILADAKGVALDHQQDESLRLAAVQLIARQAVLDEATVVVAQQLLSPRQSPRIHAATVTRLANHTEPAIAAQLLKRWRNHSPMLRSQIVNVLLSREPWTETLLNAMESNRILSSDLDASARQRLLNLKQPDLLRRAKSLLASASAADRESVLKQYDAALRLPTDVTAGKKVFDAKCASCHQPSDNRLIGPNLVALTDKSPTSLLTSILDPNRTVEAKYLSYTVADNDGRIHAGLIKAETATSITLVTAEAKEISILRSEIEELTSSGKSFMPDGLEAELSLQDVANLVEYVRRLKS